MIEMAKFTASNWDENQFRTGYVPHQSPGMGIPRTTPGTNVPFANFLGHGVEGDFLK
jgi:hypothetical protein